MKKVVFLDDETKLLEIYAALFNLEGIELNMFDDCDKALDFINSHDVDLCFIDYKMPKMNGVEFRTKITKPIIAILLTGIEVNHGLELFDEYLEKPLEPTTFTELLTRYTQPKY